MRNFNKQSTAGFTLVEIMVAVSIFAIVATICVGALLTINSVNQQAQAIKLVMDNLNFALESMTFKMRAGVTFHCDDNLAMTDYTVGQDCLVGKHSIAFRSPKLPEGANVTTQYVFRLNNGVIEEWETGATKFVPITTAEAHIDDLTFFVSNSQPGANGASPGVARATVTVSGHVQVGHRVSLFGLQTTASERI